LSVKRRNYLKDALNDSQRVEYWERLQTINNILSCDLTKMLMLQARTKRVTLVSKPLWK
jgi:hypothetical protein